jgi:hypothetical protein
MRIGAAKHHTMMIGLDADRERVRGTGRCRHRWNEVAIYSALLLY